MSDEAAKGPAAEGARDKDMELDGRVQETVRRLKEMEAKRDQSILFIGIDLGTSRTVVAASNGVRASVSSFVGYPRDLVSRKSLGGDVLYGDEALKNRLSVDLYRPLEKGVIKYSDSDEGVSPLEVSNNMRAARDLIQHAITLARPKKDELLYGVIGCPAQASIKNKQSIIEAARELLDSVVICSEPFAVAYGLDVLRDALVIDIGAGTTDLCRLKGAMPDESDQLTNTYAGDYVDKELARLIHERHPGAQFTIHQIKKIKERYAFICDTVQPVKVTFPVDGKPRQFDVTSELRTACRSIVQPMVEGLERLVGTFDPEFQTRIRSNIILGGGGSQIVGLGDAIEQALGEYGGGAVHQIEEPVFAGANGALAIAVDMPEETWEELR